MKALVVTVPREGWPAGWSNHWHIVNTIISRHVVAAVQSNYNWKGCTVTEYEWDDIAPDCAECGKRIR